MHKGHAMAVAMWLLTVLSIGFVALRLYTRARIVQFVGVEDHLYLWTGVLLLGFAASIQVSVLYGLGRSFWTLSLDDSSMAILWTYIANTFAVTGNALAKLSMGFFLLRVVQVRVQKVVLWLLIFVTAATSFALVVMLWNQTTPAKTSWDPLRTPGKWNIQIQPMSVGLGVWSSICDFFFAAFPWLLVRSLHSMPRRDKTILASGMSLGVVAGACGIARTVVLSKLRIDDYTLNFAEYFIWAGAEIAVALVCLGVPTLRPLYLRRRTMSGGSGHRHAMYRPAQGPGSSILLARRSQNAHPLDAGHTTKPRPNKYLSKTASSETMQQTLLTEPAAAFTRSDGGVQEVVNGAEVLEPPSCIGPCFSGGSSRRVGD